MGPFCSIVGAKMEERMEEQADEKTTVEPGTTRTRGQYSNAGHRT
jgi:hypothetical protein